MINGKDERKGKKGINKNEEGEEESGKKVGSLGVEKPKIWRKGWKVMAPWSPAIFLLIIFKNFYIIFKSFN